MHESLLISHSQCTTLHSFLRYCPGSASAVESTSLNWIEGASSPSKRQIDQCVQTNAAPEIDQIVQTNAAPEKFAIMYSAGSALQQLSSDKSHDEGTVTENAVQHCGSCALACRAQPIWSQQHRRRVQWRRSCAWPKRSSGSSAPLAHDEPAQCCDARADINSIERPNIFCSIAAAAPRLCSPADNVTAAVTCEDVAHSCRCAARASA